MVQAREDHKGAVQERIEEVGQMKDLVDVTKSLFELSRETAQLEAEAFALKQQVAVAQEVKTTLDSWVRHEANVRDREQKQLAAFLMEKINKDLQDPAVQQQILEQAIIDVQSKFLLFRLFFFLFILKWVLFLRCCQESLSDMIPFYIYKKDEIYSSGIEEIYLLQRFFFLL